MHIFQNNGSSIFNEGVMKGYQTSCFVCVCNLQEWELLGAISIKAWLCCSTQEPAITLPLLLTKRWKVFETQCCVISEWGVTFPGELKKGFPNRVGESSFGCGVQGAGELAALDPDGSWSYVPHVGLEMF